MPNIDLPSAIFVFGIVFWLAGGAGWVAEKTRKLKLENDEKMRQLKECSCKESDSK